MTHSYPYPRNVAGLVFKCHHDGVRSDASEGFWVLWRHDADAVRKLALRPAKITLADKSEKWVVLWAEGKVDPLVTDRGLEALQLALFASRRKVDDSIAETARRNREIQREQDADRERRTDIARSKLVDRFGNQADAELIAAAQAAGRSCWQQWRSFCVSKKWMLEFSAVDARISLVQAAWLLDLVDQTASKAEHLRDNLVASDTAVDWPDDEVARAVESLCWHDSDQATEENGAGWSKADSSKGHWCMGMIKLGGADRSIGIDVARAVVGKYRKQLAKGDV